MIIYFIISMVLTLRWIPGTPAHTHKNHYLDESSNIILYPK